MQKYGTISQPRSAFIIFAELYLGYISILNEVSDVFDQTLQVQKREVVRRILISVTKRVSELRRELCAIEMNEFIYIDQTLVDARLTPQDIVFNRPHYFPKRRPDVYNEIIDKYIHRNESVEVDEHKHRVFPVDSMKTKTGMYVNLSIHSRKKILLNFWNCASDGSQRLSSHFLEYWRIVIILMKSYNLSNVEKKTNVHK